MTEAAALLADLRGSGVVLTRDATELRLRARSGVLDPPLRDRIVGCKAALLALLEDETRGLPRAQPCNRATAGRDPGEDVAGDSAGEEEARIGATLRAVLAASAQEQAAWRREIVHALVWVEAGRRHDPYLVHDLAALRRIVPPGACLWCEGPCGREFVADHHDVLLGAWRLCPRCRGPVPPTGGVAPANGGALVPCPPEAVP